MKEVIKEKDIQEADNITKVNMLKRIAKGEAIFQK